ncbi:glycosyltransferase family 39 protein [Stenotrophomonas sp. MMGLT7]|uniref:ArnT family glycosyltransferase n=1 Tax=Stenotrophomonas sp. MMGLT7 TaxID=2901227 RepID=UPI001E5942B3|nr:glycosyltransferase family 39 protein [Stenotrophomonas sp. MMGLT7]MCD7097536.1 glycosyltransferase family 39 protein [Stenotrophomonas sp. MMGLT7]
MHGEARAQRNFVILWTLVTAVKLVVAARLPLFVDEAFYWQEGRHLALSYSDLPGMTAWMARLGVEIGGNHLLALRMPFLLVAALLPWLVVRIATQWFGAAAGWRAGSLTVLMPLSATLGILALPDVPMALAAILCLGAGARLLREVEAPSTVELALGLAIGAFSHYRFLGVIGVGLVALACIPRGRQVLLDPRVWVALLIGMLAWLPLLAWNAHHQEAGLRFQLLDRHPWTFQITGLSFLAVQALLVTPLLFVAMAGVALAAARSGGTAGTRLQWRYFGLVGGISTVLVFGLGFFTDVERVSFHWPLPGYLALLVAVPVVLNRWARPLRLATLGLAGVGLVGALGYYVAVSVPSVREQAAGHKFYPRNFAGWDTLGAAVREELQAMPDGTRVLADNFKVGAELGFVLDDADIEVLPAPLNDKHGRTVQLRTWGLLSDGDRDGPRLLVLSPSDNPYKFLLQRYHDLCALVGPLPPPRVVSLDHGYQRFLLMRLPAQRASGDCVTPAMAWIDAPLPGAGVDGAFEVQGWAFKDGVGLSRVELLLDGRPLASADYGHVQDVTGFWKISNDPQHPRVGFRARLRSQDLPAGRHWLGLRLHGHDGSVEDWWEQPLEIRHP